jgi:hypothetical protein
MTEVVVEVVVGGFFASHAKLAEILMDFLFL